ncbi:glycosyltransferase [Psychromonas sp. PT13]|uniref:glycosyltransferase n=1 Tax=Psychromonas sp. PT13 TaxID=3439547 RepID=UPI003EBFAAB3
MKILRVISSVNPEAGGPINGLINSSKELLVLGHEITVLTLDNPDEKWLSNFEFPVVSFKSSLGALKYSRPFANWLEKHVNDYDVVVIHGLWQYHAYAAAKACTKCKVPYVVFTHGMLDPWFNLNNKLKTLKKNIYWKLFEQFTINNASTVLFTSEEERNLARQSFKPYTPKENVVAYGCPLFSGQKDTLLAGFYEQFPELKECQFGLFLSRIHTKKGIDLLIEALGKLENMPEDFIIAIAGPDSDGLTLKLKKQISKLGLDNKVVWLGMLQGNVKWGAYHAAEFFILPSHQENFGIVVAEALSTSTPVLITNKVNIWREIDDAKAGFVGNDDIDGVKFLLIKWFSMNDSERLMMQKNASQCYNSNFSIKSAAVDLEKVLLSVTKTIID